jgi:osmotically-inducible protein OsmY
VNEALTTHDEVDASDIAVSLNGGVVTLSGTVRAREMKHTAEDLVVLLPGVKDVKNQITSSRFLSRIFHR